MLQRRFHDHSPMCKSAYPKGMLNKAGRAGDGAYASCPGKPVRYLHGEYWRIQNVSANIVCLRANHQPIWTCVGVTRLGEDDMRVEIEVVAHVPNWSRRSLIFDSLVFGIEKIGVLELEAGNCEAELWERGRKALPGKCQALCETCVFLHIIPFFFYIGWEIAGGRAASDPKFGLENFYSLCHQCNQWTTIEMERILSSIW